MLVGRKEAKEEGRKKRRKRGRERREEQKEWKDEASCIYIFQLVFSWKRGTIKTKWLTVGFQTGEAAMFEGVGKPPSVTWHAASYVTQG